jgi:hypothetical protein
MLHTFHSLLEWSLSGIITRLYRYKDADLARHFLRDTYCNGSWHTFDTLVTLISEGGTIGYVQVAVHVFIFLCIFAADCEPTQS